MFNVQIDRHFNTVDTEWFFKLCLQKIFFQKVIEEICCKQDLSNIIPMSKDV